MNYTSEQGGHPEASRESLFQSILDQAPFGGIVASTAPDGRCLYLNPEFTRITGYTLEDMPTVGDWLLQAYPDPAYRQMVMDNWPRDVDPAHMGRDVVYQVACKDGLSKKVQFRASLLRPGEMFVMLLDVTERERAVEQLRIRNHAIAGASGAIMLLDEDLRVTDLNPSFLRAWGFESEAQVLGRRVETLFQEDTLSGPLRERRPWAGEVVTRPAQAPPRTLLARSSAVVGDTGEFICHMVWLLDLSDLKKAQAERSELQFRLQHSEKMEAIGQLAGGIAHDFNNLLAAISGHAELLESELRPGTEESRWVEQILKGSRRAAELTRQLLAYARRQKLEFRPVDLHEVIEDVAYLLSRTIDRKIEIQTQLTSTAPVIRGDASMIHMILFNLALNARDAMPHGGTLTLSTRDVTLPPEQPACATCALPRGRYLEICVADTGEGMEPDVLARAFEPFFTTKAPGQGTGLGLASAYGSVESHGGCIRASSRPGEGSRFYVVLPAAEQAPPEEPEAEPRAQEESGHLLVVDDEELIRESTSAWMTRRGYRVSTSEDGVRALEFYRSHHESVDVVLLDLVMPNCDGAETFREMRRIDPEALVILSTGFSRNETVTALMEEGAAAFLGKPYRLRDLSDLVAGLARRRSRKRS